MRYIIKLDTIAKVSEFSKKIQTYFCDIDISQGRYTVNAKSLMGIFSMNLLEDLIIEFKGKNADEMVKFQEDMKEFLSYE